MLDKVKLSFNRHDNEIKCIIMQIFEYSTAPVISDKDWKKVWSRVDDHPKLLNQGLSIEEIVGGDKKVPAKILLCKRDKT